MIDDPSMGQYTPGFVGAFNHYLSSELGLQYTERYVSIAWTDVNFLWDYGAGPGVPVTRNDSTPLAAAMRRNPGLRVFVGAGPALHVGEALPEAERGAAAAGVCGRRDGEWQLGVGLGEGVGLDLRQSALAVAPAVPASSSESRRRRKR